MFYFNSSNNIKKLHILNLQQSLNKFFRNNILYNVNKQQQLYNLCLKIMKKWFK